MHLHHTPACLQRLLSKARMTTPIGILSLSLILSTGVITSCKQYDGRKAAENRQEWIESLNDSIKYYTDLNESNAKEIEKLRSDVGTQLEAFTTIDNPREVEPYYIYTPFKANYPLTTTGLAVRILKNETLEIIAASARPFSAIRVKSGESAYTSPTVPPDQALNYTANGLTTVSFTGTAADSIAQLISVSAGTAKVEYLNPGVTGSYSLTPAVEQLFKATWGLYDSQRRLHEMERSVGVNSRKIELLKITLHNQKNNVADSTHND